MGNKGFLKRMLPFFATFAIGVFVAGLFVGFGGPRFHVRGCERHQEYQRIRVENERLREENIRLQAELDGLRMEPSSEDRRVLLKRLDTTGDPGSLEQDFDVPPPPPIRPVTPRTAK